MLTIQISQWSCSLMAKACCTFMAHTMGPLLRDGATPCARMHCSSDHAATAVGMWPDS
jgi:hypothetical protein